MPEDEKPEPEEGSEDAFFGRFQAMLDASLSDERIGGAFDRWVERLNEQVEREQAEPNRTEPTAKAKPERKESDDAAAEGMETDDGDGAEQRRASGRVGPGRPSGYWDRVGRRLLYGRDR